MLKDPSDPFGLFYDFQDSLLFKRKENPYSAPNRSVLFALKHDFVAYCVSALEEHMKLNDEHSFDFQEEAAACFGNYLTDLIIDIVVTGVVKGAQVMVLLDGRMSKKLVDDRYHELMTLFSEWAALHDLPNNYVFAAGTRDMDLTGLKCSCGELMLECSHRFSQPPRPKKGAVETIAKRLDNE